MMFTIASKDWSPGRPLPPAHDRVGLFRTRGEAEASIAVGPTVAVSVRYDPARGALRPQGLAAVALVGPSWTAPAVVDPLGGVTPFAPIPAGLIRAASPAHWQAHAGKPRLVPRPHLRLGPGGSPLDPSRGDPDTIDRSP